MQEFAERVGRNRLTGRTIVQFRLVGGMPHERIDESVRVTGTGSVTVLLEDKVASKPRRKFSTRLSPSQTREIFREIDAGLGSLIPRSEARFPVDTVVGSITIAVNGEEETLYFFPDPTGHVAQDKGVATEIVTAVDRFKGITQRLERRQ